MNYCTPLRKIEAALLLIAYEKKLAVTEYGSKEFARRGIYIGEHKKIMK